MKLRIQNNSIRLRLTRREVAAFTAAGTLEEAFEHPGGQILYGLETTATEGVSVRITGSRITILLPPEVSKDWTGTDRVGVGGEVELGGGKRLSILVEKEFRRLHGANQDPELYPNPLENQVN